MRILKYLYSLRRLDRIDVIYSYDKNNNLVVFLEPNVSLSKIGDLIFPREIYSQILWRSDI